MTTLFPIESTESASPRAQGDHARHYLRLDAEVDGEVSALPAATLIRGRASEALDLLPAESVRTVVTSHPYWSLRDYDVGDPFGRDDTLGDYVASIVADFRKLRHVLMGDGTVWLNIGDAYTSGNRRYRAPDRKNRARAMTVRPRTPRGLKPKDLIGLPWRLAFALQDDGWWVRSEVVWHKPNAHPESVADRPTKAHETVFLLRRYRTQGGVRAPDRTPHEQMIDCAYRGLSSAAQVSIDRSDAKITIRRIQLAACTIHVEWRLVKS